MVSVIIPAYNTEEYIGRCIGSVLEGVYRDFEIIVIDDGSSDNTLAVCREIASSDERVRVYSQENKGVSAARNKGLDLAKGEYIAFIDSDDYVNEDYLERLVSVMESEDVDWVCCSFTRLGEEFSTFCDDVVFRGGECRTALSRYVFIGDKDYGLPSNVRGLYRRSVIDEKGLRLDESIFYGEDLLFNYKVSKAIGSFAYICEPLYNVVYRDDSLQSAIYRESDDRKVMDFVLALDELALKEEGKRSGVINDFIIKRLHTIMVFHIMRLKTWKERKKAYDDLDKYLTSGETGRIFQSIPLRDAIETKTLVMWSLFKMRAYRVLDILWRLSTATGYIKRK